MMRHFQSLTSRLIPLLLAAAGLCAVSCIEEATAPEEGFNLYYPSISEIAPSTNLLISPTWYGGNPSAFEISSVSSEIPYTENCFKIDETTGDFSIIGSDNLPTGVYKIAISCLVGGSKKVFDEAIVVENNVAYIDFTKCKLCRKCVAECPTGAIHDVNFPKPLPPKAAPAPKPAAAPAVEVKKEESNG